MLDGFTPGRWKPRLILMEDHVGDLSKHRFLSAQGYRLIRRVENNGWYVPGDAAVSVTPRQRWEILRKYYLALPFRMLRNVSRRLRQPLKDRLRARQRAAELSARLPRQRGPRAINSGSALGFWISASAGTNGEGQRSRA